MAKGRNVIIVGSDGNVAIGTSKGKVTVVGAGTLSSKLKQLVDERQKIGEKLTDELEKAGFSVSGSTHTNVIFPAGDPPKRRKKKK